MLVDRIQELSRKVRTIVIGVLIRRGEVHFHSICLGEPTEGFFRQCAGAMLHGAAHAVFACGNTQLAERLKIDGNIINAAIRQNHTTVTGAGLHADLAHRHKIGTQLRELFFVAFIEGLQILDGAV